MEPERAGNFWVWVWVWVSLPRADWSSLSLSMAHQTNIHCFSGCSYQMTPLSFPLFRKPEDTTCVSDCVQFREAHSPSAITMYRYEVSPGLSIGVRDLAEPTLYCMRVAAARFLHEALERALPLSG
jgi:hypothetical protein